MSYSIRFRPGVERDMSRLPRAVLLRIDKAIMALAHMPRPSGCKKLAGQAGLYRIRVGDWRIVYEIDDASRVIIIAIVGHRSDVYRGL
ncbi:MAG TPA: type II toxin-antitoxin system RelE/ParE family toxin [Phycisphaerae bacterium]|nr:type II toxin-antitoxin system RelE/ParE family toxin [Phycisphaerae bacterium]